MRNSARAASGLCATMLLAACGGGSDGEPSTPQLTGTRGNAAAYRGVWRTDCGFTLEGTQTRGVKMTLEVTSASGSTANGRLTRTIYFSTSACTSGTAALSTTTDGVTLNIDPAPVNVIGDFAGSADKVTLSAPGKASSTSHFGFLPDMSGFYISASPNFSRLELLYRKAAP